MNVYYYIYVYIVTFWLLVYRYDNGHIEDDELTNKYTHTHTHISALTHIGIQKNICGGVYLFIYLFTYLWL